MEATAKHFLRRSLETHTKKFKLKVPRFSTTIGCVGAITVVWTLVADKTACLLPCFTLLLNCYFYGFYLLPFSSAFSCPWSNLVIYLSVTLCFVFLLLGKTVFFPCQCLDVAGKVCNCFLLVKDRDPHTLSNSCRGQLQSWLLLFWLSWQDWRVVVESKCLGYQ